MSTFYRTPDFLCIGAQRAGTTWLHNRLLEHPDLYLPPEKELQFFNAFFDRGLDWYWAKFPVNQGQLCGEVTPNYLHSKAAIYRISKYLPDVKLLVILRNPIDRAYSAYQLYRESRFKGIDLRQACSQAPYLYTQSIYAPALETVSTLFPREKIHIALYDELTSEPAKFLEDVFRFLDLEPLPPTQSGSLSRQDNKVLAPEIQAFMYKSGLKGVVQMVKSSPLEAPIRRVLEYYESKRKPYYPKLREELEEYLPLFVEDRDKLTSFWGLNLEMWEL